MILYPAIDLHDGKCVRPQQAADADAAPSDLFDGDPVAVARRWHEAGATWLHVVDLDGAMGGEPRHLDLIRQIVAETGCSVQCGGGLRSEAAVEAAFAAGAERVILGTTALRNPELLAVCLNRWGRRIVVSVDSRGGKVLLAGWLDKTSDTATDFAKQMADGGVQTLVLSNVEGDGSLAGVDLAALTAVRAALPEIELIAAGGIATLDDLRALREAGVNGAILGRALTTGTLDLAEALRATSDEQTVASPPAAEMSPEATSGEAEA
jgi:phosphoribosylformimino-5-aminoimidazole carboxamide ribotide isomerase